MNFIHQFNKNKDTQKGISLIEILVVVVILGVLLAIALPQLISSRRAIRAASVSRVVFTEMRLARQQAMAQQQPISFVYDDNAKTVRLFGGDFGAENNNRNKVVSLIGNGLNANEVLYGIPPGLPNGLPTTLGDGTTMNVKPQNNKIVLVFRQDGTVRDSTNALQNNALFIYTLNSQSNKMITASAISVLGASGRVKLWGYSTSANLYTE